MSTPLHTSMSTPWSVLYGATRQSRERRGSLARGRGLILDLDDTLYPRERFVRSGFAAVAEDLQSRCDLPARAVFTTLSRAFGSGETGREFQVVCEQFGLSPRELPEMLRVFRSHRPNLWLPHESAETLRRLRAEGWSLAILTNGLPSVQAGKIDALALAPMVDQVIYAESVVRGGKPSRAAFLEALGRLGLPAERCVAVGDDPVNDVAGARNAGLRTVRIARPGVTAGPGPDADVVIHAIGQLPRVAPALLEVVSLDVA